MSPRPETLASPTARVPPRLRRVGHFGRSGEIGAQHDRALEEHVVHVGAGPVGLHVEQQAYAQAEAAVDVELLGAQDRHVARPHCRAAVAGWAERMSLVAVTTRLMTSSGWRALRSNTSPTSACTRSRICSGVSASRVVAPRMARTGTRGERTIHPAPVRMRFEPPRSTDCSSGPDLVGAQPPPLARFEARVGHGADTDAGRR